MWVEKYRPKTFDEVVGQEEAIKIIKNQLKTGTFQGFIFYGKPGVGKTTVATIVARTMHGDEWRRNTLFMNASDERSINVIREKVKVFASTRSTTGAKKVIIMDEADALTKDAQQSLRGIIEQFSNNAVFILTCNYIDAVIEPLKSRLKPILFRPLTFEEASQRLRYIAEKEGLEIDDEAIEYLLDVSDGDLRLSINTLQTASAISKKITPEVISRVTYTLLPGQINELMGLIEAGKIDDALKKADEFLYRYGVSARTISGEILRYFRKNSKNYDPAQLVNIYDILTRIDERIALDPSGMNARIHLYYMITALSRVISKPEG